MPAILDLPLSTLTLVVALLSVGFAWAGALFLRPFLRLFVRARGQENDVVGYVLSSFGVLYGILLGLTAVAAYQNWVLMDSNLSREAGALVGVYQIVSTYPDPERTELREGLRGLATYLSESEWALMRAGKPSPEGFQRTTDLERQLLAIDAASVSSASVHDRALEQFYTFLDLHRLRLYSADTGIPSILWYVVIIGAAINMILIWLLNTRLLAQLFLGGMFALFLGALILLIAVMAKPFQSNLGVTPAPLEAARAFMERD